MIGGDIVDKSTYSASLTTSIKQTKATLNDPK